MTTTIGRDTPPPAHSDHGPDGPRGSRERAARRWWRRPWVAPLLVVVLLFLAFAVPPYLTGDPARSRVPVHPEYAWYYPLLVAHIVCGSIALFTGCFQLWPWFRGRYPVAHRWMGRAYFFAGVFPAGIAVLVITPMASSGTVSVFANATLALLWLPISIAGYRMARQRRYAEHRRWMIRSFALTSSIVVNRIWGMVMLILLSPRSLEHEVEGGILMPGDHTGMAAIGIAGWLSWIVNLLIAEWWLERTDFGRPNRRRRAAAAGR